MAAAPKEDTDEIVTLGEFLEDEEAAADEIASVISASDAKRCSYDQGYVARQAVFACQTCKQTDRPAGVCLACSLACHEGHEQLVLYTKRCFRCDCGNAAFPEGFACTLRPGKAPANTENKYGPNFAGLYCVCARPYPDPEDEVEDEMLQCCVCEDWFHSRHLTPALEPSDEYCEIICQVCTGKFPFLDALTRNDDKKAAEAEKEESPPTKRTRPAICLSSIAAHPTSDTQPRRVLLSDPDWRGSLCRCDTCQALVKKEGIPFLLDLEDSVERYEARGRARKVEEEQSTEQKVADLWNGMDRVRQMEVGSRFHTFRSQLQDFFAEYQKEGKVVTKEAVSGFFQTLLAQDGDHGVPKSCTFKP